MKLQEIIEAHRSGELDIAVAGYKNHIDKENIDSNTLTLLVTALFQKGNLKEGEKYLDGFLNIKLSIQNKISIANLYLNANQPVKAEKYYKEVLKLNTNNEDCVAGLIASFVEQLKYEDAIYLFINHVDILKNNINARYNIALAYQKRKNIDKSISLYNEIIKMEEGHYNSLLNLIGLYAENNDLTNSELFFNKAKKKYPDDDQIKVSWAYALKINGKKNKAFDILEEILIKKDEINALKLAAAIKIELNDKMAALLYFKRILSLKLDTEIMKVVADILVEYKGVSEAALLYEILIKINPLDFKARSGYVNVKQFMCDWDEINENIDICSAEYNLNPLSAMAITDDPLKLLNISTKFCESLI